MKQIELDVIEIENRKNVLNKQIQKVFWLVLFLNFYWNLFY